MSRSQRRIVRLIRELRTRIGSAIVFITTSVPSMAEVADEAVVLAGGKIVERGIPNDLARRPRSREARQLMERTPRIWTGDEPPVARMTDNDPILRVDDLTKTYKVKTREGFFSHQYVQAVRGVSFDVFSGDNFGLVGESGCGKSTLSRLLSWIEPPDSGHILFEGEDIGAMTNGERFRMRRRFQLVLQDPFNCIPPHMSVGKSIGVGLAIHGENARTIAERTREVMAEVGLSDDDAGRLPVSMSAGQRQRVNIARALILEPRLMILDETLSSLDPLEQGRLLDLFDRLQARHGLTYLFISHDLAMVRRACTRIAVMYLGKMVEVADTAGCFTIRAIPTRWRCSRLSRLWTLSRIGPKSVCWTASLPIRSTCRPDAVSPPGVLRRSTYAAALNRLSSNGSPDDLRHAT
jgi:peptide/nickel transport system ATP-binding protein